MEDDDEPAPEDDAAAFDPPSPDPEDPDEVDDVDAFESDEVEVVDELDDPVSDRSASLVEPKLPAERLSVL